MLPEILQSLMRYSANDRKFPVNNRLSLCLCIAQRRRSALKEREEILKPRKCCHRQRLRNDMDSFRLVGKESIISPILH
jgi:hypothetical protein